MNIHATLAEPSARPHLLMCPPRHFAVTYSINPWMDPQAWADRGGNLHAEAQRQWAHLHQALVSAGAAVDIVEPAAGLPDLVFTANAAVVLDRKVVLSRFRYPQRRDEEPVGSPRAALSTMFSSFRRSSFSKAPAIAFGTPSGACSGSAAAFARMPQPRPSSSGNSAGPLWRCRWLRRAFITSILRCVRCPAAA